MREEMTGLLISDNTCLHKKMFSNNDNVVVSLEKTLHDLVSLKFISSHIGGIPEPQSVCFMACMINASVEIIYYRS